MLARTLAARVLFVPCLASSLACLLRRSYASPAAAAADDIAIDEEPPRAASASSSAAAVATTVPTVLQPRVLIYDGICHLCHRGVKWVIRADKHAKIKFCCVQSKAAEPYLRLVGMDQEDVLRRVLFVEGHEAYYEGSTAALKVASYLPLPTQSLAPCCSSQPHCRMQSMITLQRTDTIDLAKMMNALSSKTRKFLSASLIERKCLVVVPAIASSDRVFGCDVAQHCRQKGCIGTVCAVTQPVRSVISSQKLWIIFCLRVSSAGKCGSPTLPSMVGNTSRRGRTMCFQNGGSVGGNRWPKQ